MVASRRQGWFERPARSELPRPLGPAGELRLQRGRRRRLPATHLDVPLAARDAATCSSSRCSSCRCAAAAGAPPLAALLFAALLWTHTRAALLALVVGLLVLAALRRALFPVVPRRRRSRARLRVRRVVRPLRAAHALHADRARTAGGERAQASDDEQRSDERERVIGERAPREPARRDSHRRPPSVGLRDRQRRASPRCARRSRSRRASRPTPSSASRPVSLGGARLHRLVARAPCARLRRVPWLAGGVRRGALRRLADGRDRDPVDRRRRLGPGRRQKSSRDAAPAPQRFRNGHLCAARAFVAWSDAALTLELASSRWRRRCSPTALLAVAARRPAAALVASRRVLGVRASWTLTPGVAQSRRHAGDDPPTICRRGWTRTVRPPVGYTNALKRRGLRQYGLARAASRYQEDHLISLELGGNPTDPRNLWPEPYPRAAAVDQIENELNAESAAAADARRGAAARVALKHRTAEAPASTRRSEPVEPSCAASRASSATSSLAVGRRQALERRRERSRDPGLALGRSRGPAAVSSICSARRSSGSGSRSTRPSSTSASTARLAVGAVTPSRVGEVVQAHRPAACRARRARAAASPVSAGPSSARRPDAGQVPDQRPSSRGPARGIGPCFGLHAQMIARSNSCSIDAMLSEMTAPSTRRSRASA